MAKFHRNHNGFVPSDVLLELAMRNPDNLSLTSTLFRTQELWAHSAARTAPWFRFVGAGAADRLMYTAKNGFSLPGTRQRGETDAAAADAVINECFDHLGAIRDYYRIIHGRNSIDANGMTLIGVAHYGKDYNNAFWNSQYMVTGDGAAPFATFNLLNVWAHEMTHGVTEYAVPGGIDYYGMAGASNESFSDIGGANVESWKMGVKAKDYHWLVGKGIWVPAPAGSKAVRKSLRDMMNPGTAYNDPNLGRDRQPGHMKDYVRTSGDNGGVHTNSGIMNKFYAEFAVSLDGDDWESTMGKAARIFYAARGSLTTSRPAFGLIAYWASEACALFPSDEKDLRAKLKAAADKVGIVIDKKATDDVTPAADDEVA